MEEGTHLSVCPVTRLSSLSAVSGYPRSCPPGAAPPGRSAAADEALRPGGMFVTSRSVRAHRPGCGSVQVSRTEPQR